MNCPDCNHPQTCPCKPCQTRNPTKKPYIHTSDDFIACGECGVMRHCDEWLELEWAIYKKGQLT